MTSSDHPSIAPGYVLSGKYRVEEVIGEGGMGIVLRAHHLALDEPVAIKLLGRGGPPSREALGRFTREARAAAKIKSEHVVRTFDVAELDDGTPYMVMELLEGTDLQARLKATGPLSVHDAVSYLLQACEAVADAHALGIIHRDLKPANLFITRRSDGSECLKVLDFGISKTTSPAFAGGEAAMTHTGAVMGSPLYMPPEQMASARDANARSDIWSLGVTLYELLAGEPPFHAGNMDELWSRIVKEPMPSLRSHREDVPEGLDAVAGRCLERDPEQRYPNVAELALALVPFAPRQSRRSAERVSRILAAAGLSASAVQLPPSTDSKPEPTLRAGGGATLAPCSHTKPPFSKRTGVVLGGLALSVVILVGVVWAVLGRAPSRTSGPDRASASGPVLAPASDLRVPVRSGSAADPAASVVVTPSTARVDSTASPSGPASSRAVSGARRTGPSRPQARKSNAASVSVPQSGTGSKKSKSAAQSGMEIPEYGGRR